MTFISFTIELQNTGTNTNIEIFNCKPKILHKQYFIAIIRSLLLLNRTFLAIKL